MEGFAGWWASGHSRTMTFGKRETGKCLRAYEKGDQLFGHEENDPWVRYEVELRNNSRVLDLDLLTRPADFFAGAYDFCAELLERIAVDADPQRIPAGQKLRDATAEAALLKLGKWTRDVVAPTACWLLMNAGDMLDFIVQTEAHRLPSRLRGFSLSALRQAVEKVAAGFAPPGAPSINGA
jgi:phage replication initiation protein